MKKALTIVIILLLGWMGFALYLVTTNAEPTGISDTSSTNVIALPLATDIEAGINQYRISQGLGAPNSEVPALDQAAQIRADQMCAENDWSHNKDWEILTPYYNYAYAGENLYYGFLQKNQDDHAVNAWINSPTHQANMVDNYNEMGVAVKSCPGFQGEPTAVIVTNYFGVPR